MTEPFVDVSQKPFTPEEATGTGYTNTGAMAIGQGSRVLRADQSGLWLGAEKWVDAPFRVDMSGNVTASSIALSGYVEDVGGSYTSTATAAAAKVKIFPDANTGIIAYTSDGTTVVFKVEVGGANVGDITIGNYAGGTGMLWDQSLGKLFIKGDMTAGNIDGVTITGSSISTGATGARVVMNTASDAIDIYDSGNASGITMNLVSSTYAQFESKDSRSLNFISASGTIYMQDNLDLVDNSLLNIGGMTLISGGEITSEGTSVNIASGKNLVFSGTQGSIDCGTISSDSIDVNGGDITELDVLSFNTRSSNPSNSWCLYAYSNGGTYQLRVRLNGSTYSADLTSA